jgi:hypothetical protein
MHKNNVRGLSHSCGFFSPRFAFSFVQRACLPVAALVALSVTPIASAASISYGNQPGMNVTYINVTEASATDPVPLYGNPTVAGDTLDFNPVAFGASSQNGAPPIDLTDGQLIFELQANPTKSLSNIKFEEGGVFAVLGAPVNNNTYTHISAHGNLDIVQVDGVGINAIKVPISLTFSHRPDGMWELGTDGAQTSTVWNGSQIINLNSELTGRGIPYTLGVTRVKVDLNNTMIAQSVNGTIAFIDKKDFGVRITPNIPEPTSMCLGLFAVVAGTLLSRRRS